MKSSTSRHSHAIGRSERRGNTLVLVTAILVLLVIIATAYISRTQGGRVVAAAQRRALDREDRSRAAVGVVADVITDSLFPRLVNPNDPAVLANLAATSSTARLKVPAWNGRVMERFMVDPGAFYNVPPYETRPWTNWPDSQGGPGFGGDGPSVPIGPGAPFGRGFTDLSDGSVSIGDDNPIGNPGYGDSRWLRSTEPERAYDTFGRLGFDNSTGQQGFTHWSHLSWPATAENGWRVCYDISNVASREQGGFTITNTAANIFASGGANDYMLIQEPVALQTPYEQWLPGVTPDANLASFQARRDLWFGTPFQHFGSLYSGAAMPNFIRLNDLGPKRQAFQAGTLRNLIERTLADADGDGFTDAFWFLLPGTSEDGVRQVAAVSVVDNASMVDVNVATRFDRWGTAGHTPADIALTSRLVRTDAQLTPFGENANVYDAFDTWTGLLSDPQNATPANEVWGMGYSYDAEFEVRPSTFGGSQTLRTSFDPLRFGDSTSVEPSWLVQTGVVRQDQSGFEGPYRTPMVTYRESLDPNRAALDRRRYFGRRQNENDLFVERDAAGNLVIGSTPARGFTDADELELRMFSGNNYGPVVSTLERTINEPWNYEANFLRSSLARSESVERYLDYFAGNTSTPWPPQQGIAVGDQLSALELLHDPRHRITTYSGTRNDQRPLHLRPTVGYVPDWDYAYGRTYSVLPGNQFGTPVIQRLSRLGYDLSKQKLDLRSPLYTPLDEFEAVLYGMTEDGQPASPPAFVGPFGVIETSGVNPDRIFKGVYPPTLDDQDGPAFSTLVALDRSYRFRQDLQQLIARSTLASSERADGSFVFQSYLGSNYEDIASNQIDFFKTHLLAASWAANIDTYRDREPAPLAVYNYTGNPLGGTETIAVDAPIYPSFAPSAPAFVQNEQNFPAALRNVVFPGMEKQPFLMEAFFCTVYPPSTGNDGQIYDDLAEDEDYLVALQEEFDVFGPDQVEEFLADYKSSNTIPPLFTGEGERWFDNSMEPAVVFAVQLANPFDAPVPLHDIYIRIGDSTRNQCLNLGKLPSPHPLAWSGGQDPANPDDDSRQRLQPYYFPSELYLGPTLPDAPRTAIVFGIIPPNNNTGQDFEDDFGVPFQEFHQKWMDFMDIEPGALFGWESNLPMSQHQTLVFDASPRTYIRSNPQSVGTEFAPTIPPLIGFKPERWFGESGGESSLDQSVELIRYQQSPVPELTPGLNQCMYVIDRFDNDKTGDKVEFKDTMRSLSDDRYTPSTDPAFCIRNTAFSWAGVRQETSDFLATWVRAGRAWGWDVNRNGIYDMSEINPRYVYAEIFEEDVHQAEVEAVRITGSAVADNCVVDENYAVRAVRVKWSEDPDDPVSPWLRRRYLTPLAVSPVGTGSGGYEWEFAPVTGKPVRLSTATALVPGSGVAFGIDYNAGFPVLPDGSVRVTADPNGWPGRPASGSKWVMMDKGQAREDLPAGRTGTPAEVDANGNGVDDGLEAYTRIWLEKDRWAYPMQMLQKDAPIEQVGEIMNPFLWGHAVQLNAQPFQGIGLLPTVLTFGEIMNSVKEDDPFPVLRADLIRGNSDEIGVPNTSRIRTNRFHVDPGNPSAPAGAPVVRFEPFTQTLEIARFIEPWTPQLPAGASIFDGLVCDGPADYFPDLPEGDSDPDGVLSAAEVLAIEDQRFGNAAGFSGRATRGLININTAPVEVLRTLPHMSRLVYNDRSFWPGTTGVGGPWGGYVPSAPLAGDVNDQARPRPIGSRNIQYNRVAEAIDQYRRGGGVEAGGGATSGLVEQIGVLPYSSNVLLPYYDDRGTLTSTVGLGAPPLNQWLQDLQIGYLEIPGTPGLFPGMRRGAGVVGIGELILMDRIGVPTSPDQSWPQRSASISGAARDPYGYQRDLNIGNTAGSSGQPWDPLENSPETNVRLGLGWRPEIDSSTGFPGGFSQQTDARLSTDRNNVTWRQGFLDNGEPYTVEVPDHVAGDAEEANLLFAGLSNLVSVRSDVFTVHLLVRSFKQNPVSGVWNATDPEFIVDDSRYVFVVDRSRCDISGDQPQIRLVNRIPN